MRSTRRDCLKGLLVSGLSFSQAAEQGQPADTEVFRSGEDQYHTFRIPALLRTRKGTLLAFCEGRRGSSSDTGDIDLLLKRSDDQGKTWSATQIVSDMGADTIGNPCPVQEKKTGRIFLPLTMNRGSVSEKQMIERQVPDKRRVFICHSDNDGRSWSEPVEITKDVSRPEWTWYATGPGNGIQTRSGRLIIPCDHIVEGSKAFHSHVIYSDDRGQSWHLGGVAEEKTNECQIAELRDGTLMLNMRSYHGKNRRAVSLSKDGGLNWSPLYLDDQLIEPVCQASLIAHQGILYFLNPASDKREKMTIRSSMDDGKTWNAGKILFAGPSAYSSLAAMGRNQLGCLYECGDQRAYDKIVFSRFSTEWINK